MFLFTNTSNKELLKFIRIFLKLKFYQLIQSEHLTFLERFTIFIFKHTLN